MNTWSSETIKKTLDFWQPQYDQVGVKLTEEDAREILDNVTGLFDLLAEIDLKNKRETAKKQVVEPVIKEALPIKNKKLVNVEELAKILSVPKSWIYNRTSSGKASIPYIRVGKYLRFDPEEVIEFFRNKESRQVSMHTIKGLNSNCCIS